VERAAIENAADRTARENGASTTYLEQLRGSSEKILAAVEVNIWRCRERCG
jgi:hypothetical protein